MSPKEGRELSEEDEAMQGEMNNIEGED